MRLFAMLNSWEIVLIAGVVFLFFGIKKLPSLARGLGLGIKEFKTAVHEEADGGETAVDKTKI